MVTGRRLDESLPPVPILSFRSPSLVSSKLKTLFEDSLHVLVMVSGVECAGLVLAVLPLVVEAAKAYSDGVESILDVTARSRYDVNLQDFYDDFYVEMVRLNDITKQIGGLLGASLPAHQQMPMSPLMLSTWQSDPRLEEAFRKVFGSEDRFEEFTVYSRKILEVLESLVEDNSTRVTASEQVSSDP